MNFRNEKFLINFGKRFKGIRESVKMTQEELAYQSEISLSQIARIETGKVNPTICTLVILAKAMKVSLKEFFE